MLLRYGYIVFIGILLSLFIGVGIAAFYPSPKMPDSFPEPRMISDKELSASESAALMIEEKRNTEIWKQHQIKNEEYNKNVSIIALIASLLVLVISLVFAKYMALLADGLLLGSVFTLIYAIIRSFGTEDFKFMFVVVSVGLAVALFLGYIKFIKASLK